MKLRKQVTIKFKTNEEFAMTNAALNAGYCINSIFAHGIQNFHESQMREMEECEEDGNVPDEMLVSYMDKYLNIKELIPVS